MDGQQYETAAETIQPLSGLSTSAMEQELERLTTEVVGASRYLTDASNVHDEKRLGAVARRQREKQEVAQALTEHPSVDTAKELALHDSVTRARIATIDSDDAIAAAEARATKAADDLDRYVRRLKVTLPVAAAELPEQYRSDAALRLPLIQAEVNAAPLASIAASLRRALQDEDTAAAWCYALSLPARLTGARQSATTDELKRLVSRVRSDLTSQEPHPLDLKANQARSAATKLRQAAAARRRAFEPSPVDRAYQALYPSSAGPMISLRTGRPVGQ